MKTAVALRALAIGLTGLALVGQPNASADKAKVEEFYGTGFRAVSVSSVQQNLSDCGDGEPTTNVVFINNTGPVTYTGIMEGTGQVRTTSISNSCVPGQAHVGIRVLDTFESLTVAGRTGGAVVEIIGSGRVPATGIQINDNTVRILCGTGQLKGIHAEGTLTASIGAEAPGVPRIDYRPMQLWVHFGHRHDVGFDFLCQDLPGHDSDD
jgi:hypothetical protein